jgi:membrane-bound ClpP family serine protease
MDVLNIFWWALLLYLAYYFYNWSKEHLAFSPMLVLIVAGILIYYLVIKHPLFGAISVFGWLLISTGALMLIPSLYRLFNWRR